MGKQIQVTTGAPGPAVFRQVPTFADIPTDGPPRFYLVAQDETAGGAPAIYLWDGTGLQALVLTPVERTTP